MAANPANIVIGKGDKIAGTLLRGPENSPDIPTDSSTPAPASFADHGLIGEDGVTLTFEKSTESIRDMNGDAVKVIVTETNTTIAVPFLEVSEATLRAIFGDENVEIIDNDVKVRLNGDNSRPSSWVVNLKDGPNYTRVVVASGTPGTSGDLAMNGAGAIILPLTITASPDANGDYAIIYKRIVEVVTDPEDPEA